MVAGSATLLALAINEGAGNILAQNCLAVAAQNIVGAVIVGRKLEVLIHVVASGLLSAAGLALAINIGAAKLVHNCLTNSADDLVGAMVGALVLPAVGHVVAGSAALLALAINVGARNILAQSCIAVAAQNIMGTIIVGNKLEVLIHVLASGLRMFATDTSAILEDVLHSVDHDIAVVTDIRAGAVTVVHRALMLMLASGIRSVTILALAIDIHAALLQFQSYTAIVADFLMSAVAVTHIGHVIVETARCRLDMSGVIISRKCRRNHRKRHSTRYNKRQQTAYFFHFHKPDLLYKTIRYFLFF